MLALCFFVPLSGLRSANNFRCVKIRYPSYNSRAREHMATRDTIVIGASAGGVQALCALVADLPANLVLLSEQKGDIADQILQTAMTKQA